MMRQVLILMLTLAAAAACGCAANEMEERRRVTQAARAEYPGNARMSKEVQVVAYDHPDDKKLELSNLGDRSVPGPTVWVNGAYLHRVESIGPRQSVTVDYDDLLEAGPGVTDFADSKHPVRKVEVQTPDGLFTALGPTRK